MKDGVAEDFSEKLMKVKSPKLSIRILCPMKQSDVILRTIEMQDNFLKNESCNEKECHFQDAPIRKNRSRKRLSVEEQESRVRVQVLPRFNRSVLKNPCTLKKPAKYKIRILTPMMPLPLPFQYQSIKNRNTSSRTPSEPRTPALPETPFDPQILTILLRFLCVRMSIRP